MTQLTNRKASFHGICDFGAGLDGYTLALPGIGTRSRRGRGVGLPGILRQEEAAALLRVGTRCMENWRHRGEGPKFVRVSGRCIRYRISDLTQFIDERVRTSTSQTRKGTP